MDIQDSRDIPARILELLASLGIAVLLAKAGIQDHQEFLDIRLQVRARPVSLDLVPDRVSLGLVVNLATQELLVVMEQADSQVTPQQAPERQATQGFADYQDTAGSAD